MCKESTTELAARQAWATYYRATRTHGTTTAHAFRAGFDAGIAAAVQELTATRVIAVSGCAVAEESHV